MIKVLRKYNKPILVVGGSLLMVAFLVQPSMKGAGDARAKQVALKVDGRAVKWAEAAESDAERYAMSAFAGPYLGLLGIRDRGHHWYLATQEAERAGFVGGRLDGRSFVPTIARVMTEVGYERQFQGFLQQIMQMPQFQQQFQEQIQKTTEALNAQGREQVRSRTRMSDEEFDRALARLRGLDRMIVSYRFAARLSDKRLLAAVRREYDRAKVDYVFVPADALAKDMPAPDDAALESLFNRYKETPAGAGEFGIGYRFPPRVKFEYLKIDRETIASRVRPDPVEARKRLTASGLKPNATEQEREARKASIENDLRKESVDRILREADQFVRAEILKVTRRLDEDGPYRKLPADWDSTRPDLRKIGAALTEKLAAQIGAENAAASGATPEWLTAKQIQDMPDIGASTLNRGPTTRIPFAAVAMQAREINPAPQIPVQAGVPFTENTEDAKGNRYYFTLTAAAKESAPADWRELRVTLDRDHRRLAAFQKLSADREAYLNASVAAGLDGIVETFKPPADAGPDAKNPLELHSGAVLSRSGFQSGGDPAVNVPAVRESVANLARALDATQKVGEMDPATRSLAVAVPSSLGLFVCRIEGLLPVTIEEYRLLADRMAQQLQMQEQREMGEDPYSYDALMKRLRVELVGKQESDEHETGSPSTPSPPAPGSGAPAN
ncbi:MAG: hypothetical protein JNM07_13755 [Phycisphaerae bacterium]|nr:hypothetical protein [Phycisphaerae bacterium]